MHAHMILNIPFLHTVRFSFIPEKGYTIKEVTTDPAVEVSDSNGIYSFVMPESDVEITAAFNEPAFASCDLSLSGSGKFEEGTDFTYDPASGVITILTGSKVTVSNKDASVPSSTVIVLDPSAGKADVVLKNLNIKCLGGQPAVSVVPGASADITLSGVTLVNMNGACIDTGEKSSGDVCVTLAAGTVAVHGCRGIVQCCKQVFLDVPYLRCVLCHAVKHILDVHTVQLQKPALYHFGGVIVSGNAEGFAICTDCIRHKLQ